MAVFYTLSLNSAIHTTPCMHHAYTRAYGSLQLNCMDINFTVRGRQLNWYVIDHCAFTRNKGNADLNRPHDLRIFLLKCKCCTCSHFHRQLSVCGWYAFSYAERRRSTFQCNSLTHAGILQARCRNRALTWQCRPAIFHRNYNWSYSHELSCALSPKCEWVYAA